MNLLDGGRRGRAWVFRGAPLSSQRRDVPQS